MSDDQLTETLLNNLIKTGVLDKVNSKIFTGKEAIVKHANSRAAAEKRNLRNIAVSGKLIPEECAVKIFTTRNLKTRNDNIKDDCRFKYKMKQQSKGKINLINRWAKKEVKNLQRMQNAGINCPTVVALRKHVIVMSFIGRDNRPAPVLKDADLSDAEVKLAYEEIVKIMYKLYNEAKLVHADLNEYNILWNDGKCWIIDVPQAVEPGHSSAKLYLMRDCENIIKFFTKRRLADIYTKEELYNYIIADDQNKPPLIDSSDYSSSSSSSS